MTPEILALMAAAALGGLVQAGIGIGFSILAGPWMMIAMGAQAAVPALLLLNACVSAVAVPGRLDRAGRRVAALAGLGCLAGIAAGMLAAPMIGERLVLWLTAGLLLVGLGSGFLPRARGGPATVLAASAAAGAATAWAAMPGPLMALGLLLAGEPAGRVARLVQPVALVAYAAALGLHLWADPAALSRAPGLWALLAAAACGALAGRWLGPRLPQRRVAQAIRLVSAVAAAALVRHALMQD